MLATTLDVIRSGLKADPSLNATDRARVLALLRQGLDAPRPEIVQPCGPRILRRREAAFRLGVSLRTLDKLAATGALPKRKLPGRARACGVLESDFNALIAGGA